jgi:hypothetical protein
MNLEQLVQMFNQAGEDISHVVIESVNMVAEDLQNASSSLAPLDEGGLMQSGNVTSATKVGDEVIASVGFNTEYALRMHEDIYNLGETSEKKPDFDGMKVGRKYLQQPTEKYGQKYNDFIAEKVKGVFGNG